MPRCAIVKRNRFRSWTPLRSCFVFVNIFPTVPFRSDGALASSRRTAPPHPASIRSLLSNYFLVEVFFLPPLSLVSLLEKAMRQSAFRLPPVTFFTSDFGHPSFLPQHSSCKTCRLVPTASFFPSSASRTAGLLKSSVSAQTKAFAISSSLFSSPSFCWDLLIRGQHGCGLSGRSGARPMARRGVGRWGVKTPQAVFRNLAPLLCGFSIALDDEFPPGNFFRRTVSRLFSLTGDRSEHSRTSPILWCFYLR